ncbi:hypothetical protein LEN26_016013 [Aphanomyces euteiches]|nr:hypothetical protein LEN26_016013 [Aphanomyces euteiches]KAH9191595.1 hypothetical protein AeNC1_006433 [Aphanomyces euteiches]
MAVAASKAEYRLVKAKLRNACSQRRIRLEEFMKTFDVHKTKKISVEQFVRAIDASGVRLVKSEVDLLIAKYRLADDPRSVDYRRCCDLIDKPCTMKNAEKHLKPQKASSSLKSPKGIDNSNADVDAEALRSVKDRLATAMRVMGIVLKDVFHDFDKNNSGYVTKTRFIRDLNSILGDVPPQDVDALVKTYGQGLDVNYKQLHYDLAAPLPTSPDNNSPRPRRRISSQNNGSDIEAIEGPMRDIVARDRIRVKNFFTDYDRLRCGKCTEGQFMRAVKVCFGALTEKDLALLVQTYGCEAIDASNERKVDYIAFCKSVSSILHQEDGDNTDARIHLKVDVPIVPTAQCTRETRGELNDNEATCWNALMTRLGRTVATRRILLKPLFCDFDRGKTECVTCDQFARVLAMYNMFLHTADEKLVLLKRYASTRLNTLPASQLAFDNKSFVNYKTFCLDLDDFSNNNHHSNNTSNQEAATTVVSPGNRKIDQELEETQRTLPMVLRYLKQKAKRDRIRIDEYFRDFDRLRKGKITRSQFASGLNTAGYVLSKSDLDLLADEFQFDDVDIEGHSMVAWCRFADEIDSVFTVKGLERDPTHLRMDNSESSNFTSDSTLSAADEAVVLATLREMAVKIQQQRLDIKPPFEDFDPANQGFVSASKFERVLSVVNLYPPQASTVRLLMIKFSERGNAPNVGATSACDVNYRAFLSALSAIQNSQDTTSLPGAREFRARVAQNSNDALLVEHGRRINKPPHAVGLESLLKDIRLQVDTKRIRIKQFFAESDRLRSGEISVAKFHTAINRSGLHIDANDILTLNEAYKSKADQINYRAFLAAIESTAHVEDCRENIPVVARSEALEALLDRIRNIVFVKRLHMKPYFEDYDRNSLLHVTKTQFASVLDMMQLGCSPAEISMLTALYCVRHGRENNPDVNYLRFIQDIDEGYAHLKLPAGVKAAVKPSKK